MHPFVLQAVEEALARRVVPAVCFAAHRADRPVLGELVLAKPEMREKLARAGVNAGSSTPEELGKHLRAEVAKWAKIIKGAGIPIN